MNKANLHKELCDQIHQTYINKNHDYGDSFGKSIEEFGPVAGIVRMEDKINRIKSLIKKGDEQKVTDESMKDTLLDLANYAIMLRMELDNNEEKDVIIDDEEIEELLKEIQYYIEGKFSTVISDVKFRYFSSEYSIISWLHNREEHKMVIPAIGYLLSIEPSTRKMLYDRAVNQQYNL